MANSATKLLQDTFMNMLEEQLGKAESQEEADEIIKKFEKIDISKIIVEMFNTVADDTTRYMRDTMFEKVTVFRADEQEFLARQEQKWYRAFAASESMYIMTLEGAEAYIEEVNQLPQEQLKERSYTFTAMLHIHGRAMQQFLEIITLMKNGFADGAYARWRSMYELAIISSFITENGEKVAKAFIDSSFTDDRYEWARASDIFPPSKRYISFNDIQKNCNIDSASWRQQYDLANKTVHASPQGTFSRLGTGGGEDIISVGRSDYGITTAGEHSAISLAQITSMFFSIHITEDSVVAIKYIKNWIDVVREEYFKTHDYVFPDDEKLWDDSMVSYENMENGKSEE
ncbi:DUF5677 domain-containing protein [Lactococcus formosensis]|uniref:DUF5677 domain-containing protein n=1 Tax=Lactococcus formosensis TaxID=1281486 RepID=UPI001BCD6A05|nr:DUF5677 domain-containing protein [Lactococcus formosensis]